MKFTAILQCPVLYSIYSFVYICIYIVTACSVAYSILSGHLFLPAIFVLWFLMSFGAKSFVSLCLLPLLYELPQQTFLPDFDSQIQVEWRVVVSSSLLGQARVRDPLGFIIRRVVSFAATCQYQWLPRCVTVSLLIFIACHRQLQSHQFCNRSSSFENATTADPLSQRFNCWNQHWNWSWSQTIAGHVREQCIANTPWIAGETDLATYHTRSIATQNTGQD